MGETVKQGKLALLFAGQGAQYPGMGRSLREVSPAAAAVFEAADAIRPGTSSQCFSGTPEELQITSNTQPCVFTVDLAAAQAPAGSWNTGPRSGRFLPGGAVCAYICGLFFL